MRSSVAAYSEEFTKLILCIPGMMEDEKIDRYTRGAGVALFDAAGLHVVGQLGGFVALVDSHIRK